VGGAEQVLSMLDAALVRAGHRSLVMACEGSAAAGTLVPVPRETEMLTDGARVRVLERHRRAIKAALERYPVDVVHLHGLDFLDYLPPPGVPVVVTLHLPPRWYPPEAFRLDRPETYLHCVSRIQEASCPPGVELLPTIENGVRTDLLRPRRRKYDFVLALGRICPEKGFHLALDAAKRAGAAMALAGEVFQYDAHERYFRNEILPRLAQRRRYVGPIGLRSKRRLLAAARCLLVPSLVPETSSLVAMEALACGTPVIAFPSGALAGIVEHGRTGFLVKDVREMAEVIAAVGSVDPAACRAAAEARFSAERTCERYLRTYEEIAGRRRPPAVDLGRGRAGAISLNGARARPHDEDPPLTVEELTSLRALEEVRPEWRRLWDSCPSATPFQAPEWLIPWARHYADGTLWTLAVRDGRRLVAFAPLFVYRDQGRRKLLLLGSGNTDYLDLLAAPGFEDRAARMILETIAANAVRWDACDLLDLPPDSPLLRAELPPGLRETAVIREACPVLRLPARPEELPDVIPPGQWKKLAYYRRRLEKLGTVRLEVATATNFGELFDELLRLHEARWGLRGEPGVLAGAADRAFHREAAGEMSSRGLLRLYGLRIDGRIVAAFYGFKDAERTHYYLG
ncbi:MAG TPA: GNAT family N-acetyltransferase, partial [Planctomycetaceae bacterium]